ncbi:hypothetical protein OK351_11025 [Glutamicibacter sp. MNS18]|uniref:hypothetical protein n=1 Tax=Glutamicibacter sp. MNS18 TaxID=2989817 RepID=UPI0022363B0D|nr:hypothetical protein [Glutamicibacter sp. MNS18]MCW4466034.1 hypothetical protein [Glutamicibacter sp. MNS18]
MSPNEKFAWVAAAMVTGFSLIICLAPGLWLGVAAAVLLMACFTAVAQLERSAKELNRQHWYYMVPLILSPSICGLLDTELAFWIGPVIAAVGGAATYYLARAFPVITEPTAAGLLHSNGE